MKDQHTESIESYKKSLELSPKNPAAYNNIGVAYKALGKLEDALNAYETAISIKKDEGLYYWNKARLLYEMKKVADAIQTYREAIGSLPHEEKLHRGLIDLLKKEKRYDDALETYDIAVANIKDKSQDFNFEKAFLLAQKGRADDSVAILTNLADQNFKANDCYLKIADIRKEEGKVDEGLAVLDKAIAMNPRSGPLYLKKASILIDRDIDRAYEVVLAGNEHVKEVSYLQEGARLMFSKDQDVRAKALYKAAGEICGKKFFEKREEGDLMNYYESLLINTEYELADKLLRDYGAVITADRYRPVLRILKVFEKIMRGLNADLDVELAHFRENPLTKDVGWEFNDILHCLRMGPNKRGYEVISAIVAEKKKS